MSRCAVTAKAPRVFTIMNYLFLFVNSFPPISFIFLVFLRYSSLGFSLGRGFDFDYESCHGSWVVSRDWFFNMRFFFVIGEEEKFDSWDREGMGWDGMGREER